ncbi:UDP-N-acetylmuramoyl-L-alanyl-D-glutamate--2,6-diaminopimelate ligase [Fluoribacter dumoffii]|uniref:UDP-N-acetylmuramoyl-L-alanyl-D-glutamate--2, 6-diaminopimelate ligase n=1 Tax=Fluoribacter dumoffii TaxID=463 RepID=UPI002244BE10|nr:UDP-N-acetylmuramoyl-L-alanyl-D-glutamate--2,6-diaminopimelate ligase [Fluoribacter dumoffii]MCW8384902.1 UDP-N-acetylmuramoyl-L-alanyl-D-glutamate--2,6-diaminopimelate ligase [Fluoribacter dumoffii]MCW8496698.1 UDP-N-acetylmuramoyl-L-alanyl-D-glutamate--2,6-diaminopimelate ligase [Fluoribacter dumoffii]
MKLSQLLKPWMHHSKSDCTLSGIENDSRRIQPGDLFIAYAGAAADGRLFIEKARAAGAVAIAYDPCQFPENVTLPETIPCVPVPELATQLAAIAKQFYGDPGRFLTITGVTGTNGKTTIAYQLAQAHHLLGQGAAYIGTIGQGEVNNLQLLDNTTPDSLCLQKLLHEYTNQGIQNVCMEVSSHALAQHRVDAIEFKQAIFTNLTLDHLDYHLNMENYAMAKSMLFARESLQWAIINKDDPYQQKMAAVVKPHVKKLTYGIHQECDVKAANWSMDIHGTAIEVHSPWGQHQLKINALGQFNIYNSLAIFSSLLAFGYAPAQIIEVMAQLKAAPGRMEIVANAPYVLVDYAHTPDALENALTTLNQLKKGRLWVVFGCGGDRDKSKRPVMGTVASKHADQIIITSDNPRTEDPQVIVNEIIQGIAKSNNVVQLINREEAIAYALNEADKNDVILIAGKGHEAYQQIGSVKHAFSDQDLVKKLIAK